MKLLKRKLLFIIAIFFMGCTHALHDYHVGEYEVPAKKSFRAKNIVAQTEQFTFMGIVSDTNYVNQAFEDLQRQCPRGTVTGIQSRYSTSHGFFSWTNKVKMQASCIE